jgi:hypothetical protein
MPRERWGAAALIALLLITSCGSKGGGASAGRECCALKAFCSNCTTCDAVQISRGNGTDETACHSINQQFIANGQFCNSNNAPPMHSVAEYLSQCGGGGPASCSTITPCGGNLIGTWTVSSACVTNLTANLDCPLATYDGSGLITSGAITFNADMTYSSSIEAFGSVNVMLPAECLQGESCDQVQQVFASNLMSTGATCTGTSSCSCTIPIPMMTMATETGTYVTQMGTYMTNPAHSQPDSGPYCASGTALKLSMDFLAGPVDVLTLSVNLKQ